MEKFSFNPDQLYKLALTFFKENEGKSFHLQFDDKVNLVAFTQQANHGNINSCNLPPLGTLDVIGKQRRSAWALLGDMDKSEAKEKFVTELSRLVPDFITYLEVKVQEEEERVEREKKELELQKENELKDKIKQEERQQEEIERRKIQDALNKQTFVEFKSYAEQQYPDNPDQQGILIRQLQEQHYYQYMQQVYQQQAAMKEDKGGQMGNGHVPGKSEGHEEICMVERSPSSLVTATSETMTSGGSLVTLTSEHGSHMTGTSHLDSATALSEESSLTNIQGEGDNVTWNESSQELEDADGQAVEPEEASMWTRKEIYEFKESIRKEDTDAIIKVSHGESVTVRVPTHKDGKSLYWEFATDSYDIGFGLFFEWVEVEDTQVTVHISDSEDEGEDDYASDDEGGPGENGEAYDPETGGKKGLLLQSGPPTSCIIPVYRRDCHEEVYAGSHNYPGQGVYLLKFDNSYSLWRSKTLYYRVYYTR